MIESFIFNIFFDLALISIPIAFLVSRKRNLKKALQELGFVKINGLSLLKKSFLLFVALIVASFTLSIALGFFGLDDLNLVSETIERVSPIIPLFLMIVILRVISEEIFFRGFLVEKIGIVASSGIFALFHIGYGSIAEIIGAFVLGLILAKAFQLNKNLYPNILAHAAYNAIALWAIFMV